MSLKLGFGPSVTAIETLKKVKVSAEIWLESETKNSPVIESIAKTLFPKNKSYRKLEVELLSIIFTLPT